VEHELREILALRERMLLELEDRKSAVATIGGLVPCRRNYNFQNEEYKRVVGQIIWRIYQLGCRLEAFGEIDKAIAKRGYFGRADQTHCRTVGGVARRSRPLRADVTSLRFLQRCPPRSVLYTTGVDML
jgi:hypothetical protein